MRVCSIKANLKLLDEEIIAQVAWANQSYKEKNRSADSLISLGISIVSKNYDALELRKFF